LRLVYEEIGDEASRFLSGRVTTQPRSAVYHACQILSLRERSDIVSALDHATRFGAFEHRAIERILRARSAPRPLDEYVAETTDELSVAEARVANLSDFVRDWMRVRPPVSGLYPDPAKATSSSVVIEVPRRYLLLRTGSEATVPS
jgi:hypothetical protein